MFSFGGGSQNTGILYDVEELKSALGAGKKKKKSDPIDGGRVYPAIRGFIVVEEAESKGYGQCNNAWQVSYIAGPGFGKILYGAGYALSASKKLTSDRQIVSPYARSAWAKAAASKRGREPFDDVEAPPEEKKTPDDPSDDCIIHKEPGRESLNFSYSPEGWEPTILSALKRAHDSAMEEAEAAGFSREEVEFALDDAGNEFFGDNYESEA